MVFEEIKRLVRSWVSVESRTVLLDVLECLTVHSCGSTIGSSFSDGQLIATFERRLEQVSQIGPSFTNTASADLVSSADFTFGGEQFNFRNIARHGITNATTGSSTLLPGSAFPILTLPFVGYGIAIGGSSF